jgi:hypothetical protein
MEEEDDGSTDLHLRQSARICGQPFVIRTSSFAIPAQPTDPRPHFSATPSKE